MYAWLYLTLGDPWTVVCQVPLSMEFSRQEYWSGLPFPPSGDLPDPGVEPVSLMSPASAADSLALVPPGKPYILYIYVCVCVCVCVSFKCFGRTLKTYRMREIDTKLF